MKLIFATNNKNKLKEVRHLAGNNISIISLSEIGSKEELPETHFTIEENAFEKANFIYQKYGENCFAEDTGLEIEALNGEPGVFSARYAGENKSATDNIALVLEKMTGKINRSSKFKTVICLMMDGKEFYFTGIMEGIITERPRGANGFGYDPIFQLKGYNMTFAELDLEGKNKLSHRAKALQQLITFLNSR